MLRHTGSWSGKYLYEGPGEERKFLELCENQSCGEALVLKGCSHHQDHSLEVGREQRRKAPAPLSFHLTSLAGAFHWPRNREYGSQENSVFKDETFRTESKHQNIEWKGDGEREAQIENKQHTGQYIRWFKQVPSVIYLCNNMAGSVVIYKQRKQRLDLLHVSKVTQVSKSGVRMHTRTIRPQDSVLMLHLTLTYIHFNTGSYYFSAVNYSLIPHCL